MRNTGTEIKKRAAIAPADQREQAGDAQYLGDIDAQLMFRIAAGDREAEAALVRRNATVVARYIARVLRDEHIREDVVQDVLMRAIAAAPRYRATAKFSTWLYRIATNVALRHLEKSNKSQTNTEQEVFQNLPTSGQNPESTVTRDELRQHVGRALGALPPNQRIPLTLFQYEGLSYQQIADVMDLSVESIRALLKRARESLRKNLREFT
ncbi:MAG: RNA polymerase sigma factor [Phycisphaerae bacterium]